jgi:hypothetical protein
MNKILKNLVACSVLLVASDITYSADDLELKLYKTKYETLEDIKIRVKNISKEIVPYLGVTVEKKENDNWNVARIDISCPCRAKCKKVVFPLEPQQNVLIKWDMKSTNCKITGPGEYRAISYGGGRHIFGISQSFFLE